MRITICGPQREHAVKKVEKVLGVNSISPIYPGMENDNYKLFSYAADTFKHFPDKQSNYNVVFDGGVFDEFVFYVDEGWTDLQEQVIISAIQNVDYVIVITAGMDEKSFKFCQSFAEMFPKKLLLTDNPDADFNFR